ncbi:MAG: hypothetical protein V1816_03365 [Pseudomonadota bacterium]
MTAKTILLPGIIVLTALWLLLPSGALARDDDPWDNVAYDWGGRLKAQGSISWPDKHGYMQPVGTKPFLDGGGELRLTNDIRAAGLLAFEIHYETAALVGEARQKIKELKRRPPFLFQSWPLGDKPVDDDRRLMDLTWTIAKTDSYIWRHRLDRLNMTIPAENGFIRLGRQTVAWGNGLVFNPLDLFSPFAPTTIDRDYKVGDDMALTQVKIAAYGDFQLLYIPRRNVDDHQVKWKESSLAGKVHLVQGATTFDLMAGRHYNDVVAGLGVATRIGRAALRVDGTWTFLRDADWIYAYTDTWSFVQKNMKSKDGYPSLAANLDYSWTWFKKKFRGFVEYYYQGLGRRDPLDSLGDEKLMKRLDRGEIFVLGQSYGAANLMIELHPRLKFHITDITNLFDYSGSIQPRLVWDATREFQVTLGSNLAYGFRGTEFGGYTIPGTDLRSKGANTLYLWLAYYF